MIYDNVNWSTAVFSGPDMLVPREWLVAPDRRHTQAEGDAAARVVLLAAGNLFGCCSARKAAGLQPIEPLCGGRALGNDGTRRAIPLNVWHKSSHVSFSRP